MSLPAHENAEFVRALFGKIASRYDLANHLLSGGLDFYWRNKTARQVHRWAPATVLDLATGSGDLALAIERACPRAVVTGADFSEPMLAEARRKGLSRTVVADALALPFSDGTFDAITVAFGLRNMADWSGALGEMQRVLRPGGHLLVLDFSLPTRRAVRAAYRFYLHRCLPFFAAAVTGQKDAYQYLGASIESFPSGPAMLQLLERAAFQNASATPLTAGIVTLYTAQK